MHARIDELLNLGPRLRALPSAPDADPDPWPSIRARIASRAATQRRRTRIAAFAAAAALATLGLFATLRLQESPVGAESLAHRDPPSAAGESVEQLRERSQMLEALLAAMPARPAVERAATSLPIESLEARVQWLDYEISTADALAQGPATERLWRDRVEVMNSLVQLRYVEVQRDLL